MTVTLADVLYTFAAPALVALLVAWLMALALPRDVAARWKLASGAAIGFAVGYVLLPDWAPLWPNRHWLWLPWLSLAGGVLGAVSAGGAVRAWEQWLVAAVACLIAAVAIVPDWPDLQPPRTTLLPLVAGYLLLLYTALAFLPRRLQGRTFTALLALAAFGTASLVAYEVSVKYGQLGATSAAAFIGVAICVLLSRKANDAETDEAALPSHVATSNRSLVLLSSIALGGLAFVSTIEPTERPYALLLAPAAPLVLWLFALPPLARLSPSAAATLQILAVAAIVALIAGWLLYSAEPETDDWSAVGPRNVSSDRLACIQAKCGLNLTRS